MLKLYNYFRSSASYRVRIALHWKDLEFEYVPIHLVRDGGWQNSEEFRRVNPMGHVPALDHDGFLVAESVAIVDYLDSLAPAKRLFPADARARATVLQICELLNSGIQPLQNLKVHRELKSVYGFSDEQIGQWTRNWINKGFESLERILEKTAGSFCYGGEVTAAECFLIPQCFASRRFGVKVEDFPLIARIEAAAVKLPAFERAHPSRQPDFEK
jgi:maleylacetoacetate isomerase